MKIKFIDWGFIDEGYEGDYDNIQILIGNWKLLIDEKEYFWCIRYENYFDEEGDGLGDGILVMDNNNKDEILVDNLWSNFLDFKSNTNRDKQIINKSFNNNINYKELIYEIYEWILDNIKIGEYNEVDLFNYENMEEWGGKELIKNLEIKL